jgi:hypothetical protein
MTDFMIVLTVFVVLLSLILLRHTLRYLFKCPTSTHLKEGTPLSSLSPMYVDAIYIDSDELGYHCLKPERGVKMFLSTEQLLANYRVDY